MHLKVDDGRGAVAALPQGSGPLQAPSTPGAKFYTALKVMLKKLCVVQWKKRNQK